MQKCWNCANEFEDDFLFCPKCGAEKPKERTNEEKLKDAIPILKRSFEEVVSVGNESLLLKIDEQRSLILNTSEKIDSLARRIEEYKIEQESKAVEKEFEVSTDLAPIYAREMSEIEEGLRRKKNIVHAISMIALSIMTVAIVLGLALNFFGGKVGLTWIGEGIGNAVDVLSGKLNLESFSLEQTLLFSASLSLFACICVMVVDFVFDIIRLLTGKTKGRFHFLPLVAFILAGASVFMMNMAFLPEIGAYVLCILLIVRIILSVFMPRTRGVIEEY